MKKKGFTLAEMLITVTILGLIILIVTPNITGLLKKMDDEKYQRFLSDVFLATEAYIQNNIEEYPEISEENSKIYIYFEQLINAHYLKSDVYDPKNKKRVDEETFTVEVYLNSDDEYSYKLYEKHFVPGPTLVAAQTGETHKGIVYLDPTDLTKICTESDASANVNKYGTPTEVKTGCMKWYIFDDSGDNYKMILDHNTTARIIWSDSSSYVEYESSNLKPVVDDLVTSSGWKVTPRLITADEIAIITGNTSWYLKGNFYYFDTLSRTRPTFSETHRSSYDWLYNNLYNIATADSGCTIEDNNAYGGTSGAFGGDLYGYWTSSSYEGKKTNFVWEVVWPGEVIDSNSLSGTGSSASTSIKSVSGIRPVIEVPKSLFN